MPTPSWRETAPPRPRETSSADGLVSALNDSGQLALLIYTTAGAGPQRGTGTAGMFVVDLGLFTDDFESADVCSWSTASPVPSC